MTNEEKTEKLKEILQEQEQDLIKIRDVMGVNHKPHQYMIGPAHIKYANDHHSGMLNEETCKKVRCAHPKCNVPYEDHTHDTVCFLQLLRNGTTNEANEIIKPFVEKINDKFGESFFDGFAFVETDEKFRIEELSNSKV